MSMVPCTGNCGVASHIAGSAAETECKRRSTEGRAVEHALSSLPTLAAEAADDPIGVGPELALPTEETHDPVTAAIIEGLQRGTNAVFESKIDGVDVNYVIVSYGGSANLYRSVDNPIQASVLTANGETVGAWDYGSQGTFTFSDGETRTGWVHPMDDNEESVASRMTSREYDALVEADRRAHKAGFSDEVDPEGEMTPYKMSRLAVDRLRALVDPRALAAAR